MVLWEVRKEILRQNIWISVDYYWFYLPWMKTTQLNCLKPQYYYYYQRKMPFSSTLSSVNFLKMDIAPFSFKVLKKLFLCNLWDGTNLFFFVFQAMDSAWMRGYSLRCEPVDYSNTPKAIRVSIYQNWTYFITNEISPRGLISMVPFLYSIIFRPSLLLCVQGAVKLRLHFFFQLHTKKKMQTCGWFGIEIHSWKL